MIDLTVFEEFINGATKEGIYPVIATNGADSPDIGPKGSLYVYDKDHLAYWELTRGRHLANIESNQNVAVMCLNFKDKKYVRLFGEASLHKDGPVADAVLQHASSARNIDPERKGLAVLIRVDRVADQFGGGNQARNGN